MSNREFSIKNLTSDIEKKLGRTMQTPSDFNHLVNVISTQCDEMISAHTLMRVWGYLASNTKPSVTTLSILSRYLGFMDFRNYELDLSIRMSDGSGFIESETITAEMLAPGDELIITWNPDRRLSLLYEGNLVFKVVKNENSRLVENTEFRCVSFLKGLPFLAYIIDARYDQMNYMGGKGKGLTSLSLHKKQTNI